MFEKLIWIAAFMLVGARHPGATVGAVEKDYRSEVITMAVSFFVQNYMNVTLSTAFPHVDQFIFLYCRLVSP